jgi:YesN/AraC family two-component response regulator
MRALIVDDQSSVRRFTREILLDDGTFTSVEEAADGHTAHRILLQSKFDLAIVDIEMPGMSGLTLIAEVKQAKPTQAFLVMSALPVSEYAEAAAILGVAFLPKGCLPSSIIAAAKHAVIRCGLI